MIVHGIPGSPYVRAALLSLEEKGADYEFAAMQFGTLKQEPHLSRHPFGRIPAFEHEGWRLYETQAIMRYVDAVVPGPRLQPDEPRSLARMNQLMGICRLVCDAADDQRRSASAGWSRRASTCRSTRRRIARAIPNARHCVAEIGRLLDGNPWMAGEAISLADLLLAPHLSMFTMTPEGAPILARARQSRRLARAHRGAAEHAGDDLGSAAGAAASGGLTAVPRTAQRRNPDG